MNRPYGLLFLLAACGFGAVTPAWAGAMPRESGGQPVSSTVDVIPPELARLLAEQSPWTTSATVSVGAGYKDNLLLSHDDPESSAFSRAAIQTLVWRLPRHAMDFFGFINAEGTRYFSGRSVNDEAAAFTGVEGRYRKADAFSFTLDGQGYYLDQVFDISDTDIKRVVAELQVTGVKLGPTLRWSISPWLWIEGAAKAERQKFRDGLNDADIRESSAGIGWRPDARLELSLTGSEIRRDYDRRQRYTATGRPDDGLLAIRERGLVARADVTWDEARHWTSGTRVGWLRFNDNGPGYLNYTQRGVAQDLAWSVEKWFVRLSGEARRKDYALQTVGRGITPLPAQLKDEFALSAAVERKLSVRWAAYAEYRWERTRSNDEFASYRMNEGLLGVRWSWEK